MDAIKKKMQAMKGEKENAVERATEAEEQAKEANSKAEKVSQKERNVCLSVRTSAHSLLASFPSSPACTTDLLDRRRRKFEPCRRRFNRSKMSWIRCKKI